MACMWKLLVTVPVIIVVAWTDISAMDITGWIIFKDGRIMQLVPWLSVTLFRIHICRTNHLNYLWQFMWWPISHFSLYYMFYCPTQGHTMVYSIMWFVSIRMYIYIYILICCIMALSHCLVEQCCLTSNEMLDHSFQCNIYLKTQDSNPQEVFENLNFRNSSHITQEMLN